MPSKPRAPRATTTAKPDAAAPAPILAGAIRRESAILAAVYPAASVTERDADYLAFFAMLAADAGAAGFSVSDMLAAGAPVTGKPGKRRNPFSANPSANAADAGAHNRAEAFGHIVRVANAPDGTARFTLADAPDGDSAGAIALRNNLARAVARATSYRAANPR